MSSSIDDIKEKLKAKGLKDNFCVVPFTTLTINPDGTVPACRQLGSDFVIGNLKDNTIEEIWNGEFYQKWRQEFLDGRPKTCVPYINDKHCNLCPENIKLLDHFNLDAKEPGKILKFGANLNGFCNLKCKMCYIWQLPNGFYDQTDFWEVAEKNIFPFIKEIDLFSGEPFIQKDTYRLIDLISKINPDCEWTITTNLNWELTDFIKDKLDKIKIKNIIVSIDSANEEICKKIRIGSNFKMIMNTLEKLKRYELDRIDKGNTKLNIIANNTIQIDNAYDLGNIIELMDKVEINSFRAFVYQPIECSILSLSDTEIKKILDFYLDSFNQKTLERSQNVIRPMLSKLSVLDRKKYLLRMIG